MSAELKLQFPDASHLIVSLGDRDSGTLAFQDPFTPKDHAELAWYIETYGARALGDPDDADAVRIRDRLPLLGEALFRAAFNDPAAARIFAAFQDAEPAPGETRLIGITALHPAILALPWELLRDPDAGPGTYLFHERLSIRRRVARATGGRAPFRVEPKDRLHLLFVVSRPSDAGFIDPRADPAAVLEALDAEAPGRVTWEFLRPPTLDALLARLEQTERPVDILHFDGHGVFDRDGGLPARLHARAAKGAPAEGPAPVQRDAGAGTEQPPDTGYLLFEDAQGRADYCPADRLGANLHRRRVALVILSACQSAAVGTAPTAEPNPDAAPDQSADPAAARPLGSVAARLTATGIPAVLAMTHTVLVATTRALFGELYRHLGRRLPLGTALDLARTRLYNHPEKYQVQRGEERVWLRLRDWFLPALYQSGDDRPLLTESGGSGFSRDAPPAPRTNLPPAPESGFHGRQRELWTIEHAYTEPHAQRARRLTLSAFGGQGKTALAQEAGRWLTRTGLFDAAVWVDYAANPSRDALRIALNEIGRVLETSLTDAAAALNLLRATPTLVILDNLESLDNPELRPALDELLDAAARWSDPDPAAPARPWGTRILCTTRRPDLRHPGFQPTGTLTHRVIRLRGLGSRADPEGALDWYAALARLPQAQAPLLWGELADAGREGLAAAHRGRYAQVAHSLYYEDDRHPHQARAIARLELPNLIQACHGALAAGGADAVEFATGLNRFLGYFGLGRESADLLTRVGAAPRVDDGRSWFLAQSNQGERLLTTGRVGEALDCFAALLARLGEEPGYERAVTLAQLGRCLSADGRPDLAAARQREQIAVLDLLGETDQVRRQRGVALTDLADALVDCGDYAGARVAYESGLEVDKALDDERGQGVILVQLGTLALREDRLDEAERIYREALDLFERLREPPTEAVLWHQLGMVYERVRLWGQSERHYREAARIREQQGLIAGHNGATASWIGLAFVTREAGRRRPSTGTARRSGPAGTTATGPAWRGASTTSPTCSSPNPAASPRPGAWRRSLWRSGRPWTRARRRSGRPTRSWPRSPSASPPPPPRAPPPRRTRPATTAAAPAPPGVPSPRPARGCARTCP